MRLRKVPLVRCYQVLNEVSTQYGGLTAGDHSDCFNRRYGVHGKEYWNRQLQALADMGYAEKSGRWFKNAAVWVTAAPDEQQ
jgi:hypothetical protein